MENNQPNYKKIKLPVPNTGCVLIKPIENESTSVLDIEKNESFTCLVGQVISANIPNMLNYQEYKFGDSVVYKGWKGLKSNFFVDTGEYIIINKEDILVNITDVLIDESLIVPEKEEKSIIYH